MSFLQTHTVSFLSQTILSLPGEKKKEKKEKKKNGLR
jgi:hypothetical protein